MLCSAGAGAATPPSSESYSWRNVPIGGGGLVSGLLFHPTQPGLLYARTDVGGAYRWDTARNRWLPLNDALGRSDAELLGVLSFAVDNHDAQRLFLACGSYLPDWAKPAALLASADQGASWQRVPLPFRLGGNSDGRTAGERLQVDPHVGTVLFLGTNQDGLWRSADRGLSWQRVAGFPAAGVTFVLIDPAGGKPAEPAATLYAGATDLSGPILWRSRDGGASWSPVAGQPAGLMVHHAALAASGELYLTYADGPGPNGTNRGAVWKYTAADGRWQDISPVTPDPVRHDTFSYAGLALDPRHPGTVMVSTLDRWTFGDEIFRSTDGGTTWKPLLAGSTWDHTAAPYTRTLKPHWIGQLALDPFDTKHALFITGYGVWATAQANAIDQGAATPWTFADDGLEETVIEQLVSPPAGAPLLSALSDFGGFRHADLNSPAVSGAHNPANGSNPSIDFAEQLPAKMVRTHWGPARGAISTDGGGTWRDFAATPPPAKTNAPGIVAIAADGGSLVWVPKGSAPYFSIDNGATWTASRTEFNSPNGFLPCGPVADRANPAKYYLYNPASGAVYVSDDGGRQFTPTVRLPAEGGMPRAEPGREGRIWVPTPDGLYRSTDSGRHFTAVSNVHAAYQVGFGRAAPGRTEPAIYLAGRVDDLEAIFRSDDGGVTWTAITTPQEKFGYPKTITGDPRVYGRVYLGTGGRGLLYGEPTQP